MERGSQQHEHRLQISHNFPDALDNVVYVAYGTADIIADYFDLRSAQVLQQFYRLPEVPAGVGQSRNQVFFQMTPGVRKTMRHSILYLPFQAAERILAAGHELLKIRNISIE